MLFDVLPFGDQLWVSDMRSFRPPQLEGTPTENIPMTVWNVGTANATINAIVALGDYSEMDNCGAQAPGGATLSPGMSCTLQLSATPGGAPGDLVFFYDGGFRQEVYGLPLFSTTQPVILSASAINFGTQQVNGVALPRVVTVTNTSNATVSAPFVSMQGDPEFVITGNTCASVLALAPHQSCVVGVQFNPVDDGAPSATLNISGQLVALYGQGQIGSLVHVSPLELDFYPVPAGQARVQTLTLTNSSASPVAITAISCQLNRSMQHHLIS